MLIATHVKFAPFASRRRRGYLRDVAERDLGVQLETALRGAIVADRWPKSGLEVSVVILEGVEDRWWGDAVQGSTGAGVKGGAGMDGWGLMSVLAGCITAASAAIADARIDCLDLVAGGMAAVVEEADRNAEKGNDRQKGQDVSAPHLRLILDPDPAEHASIVSAAIVGYMPTYDELTELWLKGSLPAGILHHPPPQPSLPDKDQGQPVPPPPQPLTHELLIDAAVDASRAARAVLADAVRESAIRFARYAAGEVAPPAPAPSTVDGDVEMSA